MSNEQYLLEKAKKILDGSLNNDSECDEQEVTSVEMTSLP